MLDSLDLQFHRHGRKRQSGHTQSSPNRPVTGNASPQCLNKGFPLVVHVELVAAEEIHLYLCQTHSKSYQIFDHTYILPAAETGSSKNSVNVLESVLDLLLPVVLIEVAVVVPAALT
jgi:hypothetical protein